MRPGPSADANRWVAPSTVRDGLGSAAGRRGAFDRVGHGRSGHRSRDDRAGNVAMVSGAASAEGIGSRLDGTVSTHLVRLLVQAARQAGVAEEQLARVSGTDEVILRGELNRIPMGSLLRLWELIAGARPGGRIGSGDRGGRTAGIAQYLGLFGDNRCDTG